MVTIDPFRKDLSKVLKNRNKGNQKQYSHSQTPTVCLGYLEIAIASVTEEIAEKHISILIWHMFRVVVF